MVVRIIHFAVIAAAIGTCAPCVAQDRASDGRSHRVVGEKLDSGLGQLPHYREWRNTWKAAAPNMPGRINTVPGEKLDNGLGELPPHRSPSITASVVRSD